MNAKMPTQKQESLEEDLLVSLTLHNFSATMIKEFALKIAKPYFGGNLNEAVRHLMQKAVVEETLFMDVASKNR